MLINKWRYKDVTGVCYYCFCPCLCPFCPIRAVTNSRDRIKMIDWDWASDSTHTHILKVATMSMGRPPYIYHHHHFFNICAEFKACWDQHTTWNSKYKYKPLSLLQNCIACINFDEKKIHFADFAPLKGFPCLKGREILLPVQIWEKSYFGLPENAFNKKVGIYIFQSTQKWIVLSIPSL